MRRLVVPFVMLGLSGCGARDCMLGIAHRDCVAQGASAAAFPEDHAICRAYGLQPGTRDYAVCRHKKHRVQILTGQETDYGVLREPLLPSVR